MPIKDAKTSKIIDELKKRKNSDNVAVEDEEQVELVFFKLLDHFYAIFGTDAKEILPLLRINQIPGAPTNILGVINVRGDIESVLDINQVLGLPPQPKTHQNRIIIAESLGLRSGILTGTVHDVIYVPKNSVKPPLTSLTDDTKDFVKGETLYNSSEVTLLDIGMIFKKALV